MGSLIAMVFSTEFFRYTSFGDTVNDSAAAHLPDARRVVLPAGFDHSRQLALRGEVSEADTADAEFPEVSARPSTNRAAL
jgi:hypothetical protein